MRNLIACLAAVAFIGYGCFLFGTSIGEMRNAHVAPVVLQAGTPNGIVQESEGLHIYPASETCKEGAIKQNTMRKMNAAKIAAGFEKFFPKEHELEGQINYSKSVLK